MSDSTPYKSKLPQNQQAIRDKCFHPSGTFVEFPMEDVEQSIPERFEKIVQMHPERLAVKTRTEILTYAELNNTANWLAQRILTVRGCGAEPIGVLVSKKTALVCAILAILKAGKFVVLLDPAFPKARTSEMLEDSQARLVIADRENLALGTELLGPPGEIMNLELDAPDIPAEEILVSINSKDFAFIFYTSGSTGDPKGVIQTHRNILHNLMLRMKVYNVSEHDRVSLLASGTSNAVINMFLAVLNGAGLFPFDVQIAGVSSLADWLARERISICFISGPLFRAFYESLSRKESFPDLRALRLTSETIYKTDVDIYKKAFSPTCVLVCGLSSSESGPLRKYLINHNTKFAGNDVPVGFALADKEVFLVDANGNRVGVNEVGEVVVRSRYLSPGYWRRPDLTKAKFKADPNEEGFQLYFTGDLGLMLPDGCLIHKGRKDFRVKVRGYGVEIGDLEKALLSHGDIKETVVVARPSEVGEVRLHAYFTTDGSKVPSVSELRTYLKEKLPEFMIPSRLMWLDALPLTAGGKVDRRALPDPGNSRPELDTPYLAPRNRAEEELSQIWIEVLGLEEVGIYDNFFDLGGQSLAATRVVSRVLKRFQLEIPLQSLLQSPTVAEMAAVITQHQGKQLGQEELDRIVTELECDVRGASETAVD